MDLKKVLFLIYFLTTPFSLGGQTVISEFGEADENSEKTMMIAFVAIVIFLALILLILIIKRNKKNTANYNKLIERLKTNEANSDSDIKMDFADDEDHAESKSQDQSKIVNISTDTEKKLLKKLAVFEESERFLRKDISLTSMSHSKGTNPKYLSKIIRTHKNNNFSGYINSLRINYIVQKLYNDPKYREYKISYLADECGYTSSQVFVIAFKKETGFTPSYFIEQIKLEQIVYK
ncbi:helix-turn-helix domain-containing protein [Epilithonimonas arachidiradicis]|uniref:AraC-like DNA-binding protein n=1 Tax=Epilithonimonas arachidiradicis TaxID=1617282 RepID=A0A420DDY8_9FLAO|nr:AraC family transcriptional regulator [Epilithonimonas arachidiradicis]RKE90145.1 AraC-like DNA-binding protein [Epilithonimonas arachidiradicis]GGG48081.1 hypothetical protein GCM10007332_07010 [Epilithonimonas arachidiradicis]